MNIEKLEKTLQALAANPDEESFIYDLLLAYDLPKAAITLLKKGDRNLSANSGEILWKKKLFFRKEFDHDLHVLIDDLKNDPVISKQQPRFIIVSDFKTLLALDTKTDDTLDIQIEKLASHYDFFLPWAGREKTQQISETLADIKAAERMGRLYDIILEENPCETDAERHSLNIFLSRLLFCFFAEDTGIFSDDQFTNAVASHTDADGSDLQSYLQKLFQVLSREDRAGYPQFLKNFPYVNGGLFANEYPVPRFGAKARKIIIECGALNWKEINPDIFGSMIQAVVHSSQRGNLGMHYTSVVNIMKVIEPLFLNDLQEEFEKAGDSRVKLNKLLARIANLRIFDPACGSGNFLIIVYKELCRLEIEIFKKLYGRQQHVGQVRTLSNIKLTQFYGIELDDFAHETAKLSLWLAEHQMNLAFKAVFNDAKPTLPLQDGGNIVCGNATRLDWEEVCPKEDGAEIYVLGNPPYLGSSMQSKEQKADMAYVFDGIKGYKNLDYISCWFLIGSKYISGVNAQLAFVSTNSICQGEQAGLLWSNIIPMDLEIGFAHQSFKWTNNAKGNAGVTCVVVGVRESCTREKILFKDGLSLNSKNINPYLINGNDAFIRRRSTCLSLFPEMVKGNQPTDGGNFVLSMGEMNKLLSHAPNAQPFIKKYFGSQEFIKGLERYCLWINDKDKDVANNFPEIRRRIDAVRAVRQASRAQSTRNFSGGSHRFIQIQHEPENAIILPSVSSERRQYIPTGFVDDDTVISNLAFAIYNPPTHIFAIISSRIHMTWVRAVAGRLKTDYRYSSALCYNTFPFPEISEKQKTSLEDHVFNILDEREQHSEKTMAQLYDPDKMPDGLRQAHHEMDQAVEKCYRPRPFKDDEERLEYLFKLYEQMIAEEKKK